MITSKPITLDDVVDGLVDAGNGAVVTFAGVVRDSNHGRPVTRIYYEAYSEMAERELTRIVDEALISPGVARARVVHRIGDVQAGEASLVVAVSGPHRLAVFDACMRIVDEIKKCVPIWKKEFYADGSSGWI